MQWSIGSLVSSDNQSTQPHRRIGYRKPDAEADTTMPSNVWVNPITWTVQWSFDDFYPIDGCNYLNEVQLINKLLNTWNSHIAELTYAEFDQVFHCGWTNYVYGLIQLHRVPSWRGSM